jgi:hypothetical protein
MRFLSAACVVVIALLSCALPASAQSADAQIPPSAPPPLDKHELLKKYVWSTLGPSGLLSSALTAGLEQWRGSPEAWEMDEVGYGKRWASEYAASAIGNTTKYAVARMMHQDPSFVPCECVGVRPRLAHAMAATFKARKMNGEWEFSPATVLGLTAQAVVPAATWYPAPHGVRDGAAHAASAVLSKMAVDVVKEFLPERFRKPKI